MLSDVLDAPAVAAASRIAPPGSIAGAPGHDRTPAGATTCQQIKERGDGFSATFDR